jgi:hypothetical protein
MHATQSEAPDFTSLPRAVDSQLGRALQNTSRLDQFFVEDLLEVSLLPPPRAARTHLALGARCDDDFHRAGVSARSSA